MMYSPQIVDQGVISKTGYLTVESTSGWSISPSGSTYLHTMPSGGKPVKYLYKAYVIIDGAVHFETPALIAKDEVSAKVKAILMAQVPPDDAHVILQEIGEIPDEDE